MKRGQGIIGWAMANNEAVSVPGDAPGRTVPEVFVTLPPAIIPKLQDQWAFHVWNEAKSEARLITSFDTEESDVRDFAALVRETIGSKAKAAG